MAKKEVSKKVETGVAITDERPDWMERKSDRGNEDVGMNDVTIPRLDILQDLSPQIKKNKPEYIESAEAGMLFNTVTKDLYGNSVMFVPVYFRKEWVIWKDIKAGGGFRGSHETKALALEALAELEDAEQCELVDTGQHFGLIVHGDRIEEAVISMSKSKMKPSRQLNSMVKIRGGDRFSSVYEIKAVEDQNAAGQDYWNLAIRPLGYVSEELFKRAEKLYEAVKLGVKDVVRDVEVPKEGDEEF